MAGTNKEETWSEIKWRKISTVKRFGRRTSKEKHGQNEYCKIPLRAEDSKERKIKDNNDKTRRLDIHSFWQGAHKIQRLTRREQVQGRNLWHRLSVWVHVNCLAYTSMPWGWGVTRFGPTRWCRSGGQTILRDLSAGYQASPLPHHTL